MITRASIAFQIFMVFTSIRYTAVMKWLCPFLTPEFEYSYYCNFFVQAEPAPNTTYTTCTTDTTSNNKATLAITCKTLCTSWPSCT
jgi:hypothetical protein